MCPMVILFIPACAFGLMYLIISCARFLLNVGNICVCESLILACYLCGLYYLSFL
jgi:hypothetical protein